MFLNCPLCLNFPNLALSFARVAFLCESLTTLPHNKRKCVKASYFAFCFFCASYCSRVIHFGLFSILFRSSLLRSLSILFNITDRYFRNSQKLDEEIQQHELHANISHLIDELKAQGCALKYGHEMDTWSIWSL